jgi:competence protein ComEC
MRINILAFALGVGLLQIQERLPALPLLAGMLLGLGALFLLARRQPLVARTLTALICALLGCSWAALLAEQRLLEQLPAEWEGRDVQVVGVVAALPHAFERSERFEFVVESVETAGAPRTAANHAVVVSRLAGRRMARGTGHSSGRAAGGSRCV